MYGISHDISLSLYSFKSVLASTYYTPFPSLNARTKHSAFKTCIKLMFVHLTKLVVFTQNLETHSVLKS